MKNIMFSPPIVLVILLAATLTLVRLMSGLSFKRKTRPEDIGKSYACGEDTLHHLIQPDYSQFFPFAFFFTIIHVIALIVTTVPLVTAQTLSIAVIYIMGAVAGLFILFRR
jgi:NADH-quinone oxidoreductase subunit A